MDMDNIPSNPAASQLELPHSKIILPARPLPPQFTSWAAVKVPRNLISWARLVTIMFGLFFLTLVFVPWTQTISAQGKLSAYSPIERPQLIHAPIEARVHNWLVDEGMEVRKNDLLLELVDVDPQFMAPDLLVRLDQSIQALEERREASLSRAYLLEEQIDEMTELKRAALDSAGSRVQEATNRIRSAEQRFEAAKVGALTARLNLERSHILEAEGLISRRELELAIQAGAAAQAELKASDAALDEVTQSRQALAHARARIEAELVQQLLGIRGQRAAALEEAARASKEIADLTLTRSNAAERRIAGRILSPIDGTVVRMKRIGSGEIVRQGDPLMTVVPSTAIRAVEMWTDPLDAPLLTPGRPVRLLFQGIPAIPLPAWPSFMAGTYNGRILVVDQSSDEQQGGFRFWVAPDPELRAWPPQTHVRQGTPVMGWVILSRVPFWYEFWRRVNFFPPDFADPFTTFKQKLPDTFVPKAGRGGK